MSSDIPPLSRSLVAMRSGSRCEVCGGPAESLHHRRHLASGGSRLPDTHQTLNLLSTCGSGTTGCHGRIEANSTWARSKGYTVLQRQNPLLIPVRRFDWITQEIFWVQLDACGGYRTVASQEVLIRARQALMLSHCGHVRRDCDCRQRFEDQLDTLAREMLLVEEVAV